MMTSHCKVFGRWNIGGLLSKLLIRQNKFPVKISGHSVVHPWGANYCTHNTHNNKLFRTNRFPKTWFLEDNKADLYSCGLWLVEAGFVLKYRTAGGGVDLLCYPKWLKNNCILDCNDKVPWITTCITITIDESLWLQWLEHIQRQ